MAFLIGAILVQWLCSSAGSGLEQVLRQRLQMQAKVVFGYAVVYHLVILMALLMVTEMLFARSVMASGYGVQELQTWQQLTQFVGVGLFMFMVWRAWPGSDPVLVSGGRKPVVSSSAKKPGAAGRGRNGGEMKSKKKGQH